MNILDEFQNLSSAEISARITELANKRSELKTRAESLSKMIIESQQAIILDKPTEINLKDLQENYSDVFQKITSLDCLLDSLGKLFQQKIRAEIDQRRGYNPDVNLSFTPIPPDKLKSLKRELVKSLIILPFFSMIRASSVRS